MLLENLSCKETTTERKLYWPDWMPMKKWQLLSLNTTNNWECCKSFLRQLLTKVTLSLRSYWMKKQLETKFLVCCGNNCSSIKDLGFYILANHDCQEIRKFIIRTQPKGLKITALHIFDSLGLGPVQGIPNFGKRIWNLSLPKNISSLPSSETKNTVGDPKAPRG